MQQRLVKNAMSMFGKRPKTLREVARRVQNGEQKFDPAVLEFLDSFYANPELRASAIEEPPERIDALRDAYLAAVAEHLARSYGLPIPEWTETQGHDLHKPFFAGGLETLKGILVAEKPGGVPPSFAVCQQGCFVETAIARTFRAR